MTKGADSNNVEERKYALNTLLVATRLSKSVVQMKRTLTFIRTKIKNESTDNREAAIQALLSDMTQDIKNPDPVNSAYTDLLLDEV